MRIASLVPAGTEIVAALGGAGSLAAISHECDYPPSVLHLPRVTVTAVDPAAPGPAIDRQVRALAAGGRPVIAVDRARFAALGPVDLIITQGLCEVCAAGDGAVRRLADAFDPPPAVLSLSATTLPGVLADIERVGQAIGLADEAAELTAGLRWRLQRLSRETHTRVSQPLSVPRVLAVEWLDPLYLAGHWVPELVAAAGGEAVGAEAGQHSRRAEWHEAARLRPDLVVVMLCGFGIGRAREELARLDDPDARRLLASGPVWILDGNAYTSRPGPRVVDGAERIRAAMLGTPMAGIERGGPEVIPGRPR